MKQKILLVIFGMWAVVAQASDPGLTRDQVEQLRKEVSYGAGYHEFGGVVQRTNLDVTLVRKGLLDAASLKGAVFNSSPAEIDQMSNQWISQQLVPQGADLQAPSQNANQWGVRQRLSYAVGANTMHQYVKNAFLDQEYFIKGIFDAYGGEKPKYVKDIMELKGVSNKWIGFLQYAQKQQEERERKRTKQALERSMDRDEVTRKAIQESIKNYDSPETQHVLEMLRR